MMMHDRSVIKSRFHYVEVGEIFVCGSDNLMARYLIHCESKWINLNCHECQEIIQNFLLEKKEEEEEEKFSI